MQGVGFRPYVFRLSNTYNLVGWVKNTSSGIEILLQGSSYNINLFIDNLKNTPPPLSNIESIVTTNYEVDNSLKDFKILTSLKESDKITFVSPDVGICHQCINDILNPLNKRYYYPFANCTNCGPRFSIINSSPYDRNFTSMKNFIMCEDCKKEYSNPLNRRFHAEPNCCPTCGPFIYILDNKSNLISTSNSPINSCKYNIDTITYISSLLKDGYIIAIKGLGGFHLCCNALNENSINNLRVGKHRNSKPLALMAKNINMVKDYCHVSLLEENLLSKPTNPIVLLNKKDTCKLPDIISPNNYQLGFMLPYTPLYILIFENIDFPLIVTSGNISSLPLCYENSTALDLLSNNCDYFVMNNRNIEIGIDDSLITTFNDKEYVLRRARGYAPTPLNFTDIDSIIATGANMKNTFAIGKENHIFISQHIGDIDNYETLEHYKHSLKHYMDLFDFSPKYVACDLHPNYDSTKVALSLNLKTFHIQHHHAHIVSCMYENNFTKKVIGISFDGTGYGSDGSIWGGEFLICDYKDFTRVAHLDYVPLIGGDNFIKDCYKSSLSHLYNLKNKDIHFFSKNNIDKFIKDLYSDNGEMFFSLIEQNIYPIKTSSMGRLFDAVSSLLNICHYATYEGQGAIELQSLVDDTITDSYPVLIEQISNILIIRCHDIIKNIIIDLKKHLKPSIISSKFHNTLANIILDTCILIRSKVNINEVALSGGVFQNIHLLNKSYTLLKENGFNVFTHHLIPSNDGGICLGQIIIANELLKKY